MIIGAVCLETEDARHSAARKKPGECEIDVGVLEPGNRASISSRDEESLTMWIRAGIMLVVAVFAAFEAGCGQTQAPRQIVYAGSTAGTVFALDASDGSEVWSVSLGDRIPGSPVLDGNRLLVAVSGSRARGMSRSKEAGRVVALRIADGKPAWSVEIASGIDFGVALASGRVLVGTRKGTFMALDADRGDILWRRALGTRPTGPPLVCGRMVAAGTKDATIHALALGTGEVLWRRQTGDLVPSQTARNHSTLFVVLKPKPGRPLSRGAVWALHPTTGRMKWSWDGQQAACGALTANRNTAYVLSLDTHVYAIDAGAGKVRWQRKLAKPEVRMDTGYRCRPIVVGSSLIIHGHGLRALATADGKEQFRVPCEVRSAGLAFGAGLLVLGTYSLTCHPKPGAPGSVLGIDPRNGSVRWRFERRGHGFLGVPKISR